jgi:hypothetical protein
MPRARCAPQSDAAARFDLKNVCNVMRFELKIANFGTSPTELPLPHDKLHNLVSGRHVAASEMGG